MTDTPEIPTINLDLKLVKLTIPVLVNSSPDFPTYNEHNSPSIFVAVNMMDSNGRFSLGEQSEDRVKQLLFDAFMKQLNHDLGQS